MINMPPRHGKSELASRRFPAWFLGRNPERSIIAASYNSDLAGDFGRQVRNIVADPLYRALYDVDLADDSRAANRWNTKDGGAYVAAGVGTAITGRGADVLLIDDPLKDREEADSELQRNKVWDWYTSTGYTRLAPGGRIIVIQCMTGDTPVLMETGTEKPLRDVRPGDRIATYENGRVTSSTVRNWANQGPDRVFEIRMKSGIIVRANARHPFLVLEDGEAKWRRTQSLDAGSVILRVIGGSGGASHAHSKAAESQQSVRDFVVHTTTRRDGVRGCGRLLSILGQGARRIYATATGSVWRSMSAFWPSNLAYARCANSHLPLEILAHTGTASFASIIATIAKRLGGFSATTATSQSGMGAPRKFCLPPLSTFAVARDVVVDVVDAGVEDVFDIQVDRTENFIANGLISHNTRWHEDDLSGRLLEQAKRGGDKWEVLELPAINDAGEALWPEFYPLPVLERLKAVLPVRDWTALYQQRPAPEEGDYFKREWFRYYDKPPPHLRMYGASDYAVTAKGGDYTVHAVIGVAPNDDIYVLDVWRAQVESNVWVEKFIDLIDRHKPLTWGEEQGQIIKSLGPFIDRRMRERRVYCHRVQMASVADKPTRCRAFQARAAMGKVYIPHQAPWVADFQQELLSFPTGKHDDQVDVMSIIGRMLDTMVGGVVPKADGKPESRWDRAFARARENAATGGDGVGWKGI